MVTNAIAMRRSTAARWIATWFGCGLSPLAPGTLGSLGAIPLHLLICDTGAPVHALLVFGVCVTGIWAAQRHAEAMGQIDPQSAVIDEVAGTLIALWFVRSEGLVAAALAVVLFRVLDIWKPGPIRRVEHMGPPGIGIMVDDFLAGLIAGASVWLGAQVF